MKKIGIALFSVYLLVGVFGTAFASGNIIVNPSFDDGLNDWNDLYGLPADVSTAIYHSGPYAATKYVDPTQINVQDYWSQLYQEINLSAGETAYASAYIKTTFLPASTARASLMIEFLDTNGEVIANSTINAPEVGGQTDWRLIQVETQAAPTGTVKARVSCYIWAKKDDTSSLTGAAYFDDVYFDKVYRVIGLPNYLRNRNFENGLNDWFEVYGLPAELTTTVVHGGTYAAAKKIDSVAQRDYWTQLYQDIKLAGGQKIVARAYVKNNFSITSHAKVGLQLEFFKSSGTLLKTLKYQLGKTDWRQITVGPIVSPAGTAKVRLSLYVYAPRGETINVGKYGYFDDVSYITVQSIQSPRGYIKPE